MFDKEEFIEKFVKAALEENNETMKELSDSIANKSLEFRTDLLEVLVKRMKKDDVKESYTTAFDGVLSLMKVALEAKEADEKDSTVGEAKDVSKAEEATQDVAATSSAEVETKVTEHAEVKTEEGEAPAEEVKEEKTEQ